MSRKNKTKFPDNPEFSITLPATGVNTQDKTKATIPFHMMHLALRIKYIIILINNNVLQKSVKIKTKALCLSILIKNNIQNNISDDTNKPLPINIIISEFIFFIANQNQTLLVFSLHSFPFLVLLSLSWL